MANATAKTEYTPSRVSPPGETLRELIEERGLTQTELAERTGRTRKTINEILLGKAKLTPETALQFELVLGVSASFWNARESKYREYLAREAARKDLQALGEWVKGFPVQEMIRLGWLPSCPSVEAKAHALLEFFGVASPEQWTAIHSRHAVAFRKSVAFEADEKALAAWLRAGEIRGQRMECAPYEEEAFREVLQEARKLTREPPEVFQSTLCETCARTGVAVAFVPQLKRSRAHGATRWLAPDRALIQLSIRYKSDDHLWFTFFHEAAHILFHRKKDIFIESNGTDGEEEEQANRFAADFLIPPESYGRLASTVKQGYSKTEIKTFAKEIGVSPGIVVGRLQHDGLIPYSHLNDLKLRLKWA
jgi:HTH-type transcriptional regulator / antitoxin HigA